MIYILIIGDTFPDSLNTLIDGNEKKMRRLSLENMNIHTSRVYEMNGDRYRADAKSCPGKQ